MTQSDVLTPSRLLLIALTGWGFGGVALLHSVWAFQQQQLLTPVVIMDRLAFLRSLPTDEANQDRMGRLKAFEASLERFQAGGYLVLDASSVLSAPDELRAPIPVPRPTP